MKLSKTMNKAFERFRRKHPELGNAEASRRFDIEWKERAQKAKKYSRGLKRRITNAERILCERLTARGIYFKFQVPFWDSGKCYIVDFILPRRNKPRLGIEVDGESHTKKRAYDFERSVWLFKRRNIKIIRYTNKQIEQDCEAIVGEISQMGIISEAGRKSEQFINAVRGDWLSEG